MTASDEWHEKKQMSTYAARRWSWPTFPAILVVQLRYANLIAFFMHKHCHVVVRCFLGWKSRPKGLLFPPSS